MRQSTVNKKFLSKTPTDAEARQFVRQYLEKMLKESLLGQKITGHTICEIITVIGQVKNDHVSPRIDDSNKIIITK